MLRDQVKTNFLSLWSSLKPWWTKDHKPNHFFYFEEAATSCKKLPDKILLERLPPITPYPLVSPQDSPWVPAWADGRQRGHWAGRREGRRAGGWRRAGGRRGSGQWMTGPHTAPPHSPLGRGGQERFKHEQDFIIIMNMLYIICYILFTQKSSKHTNTTYINKHTISEIYR